MFDNGTMGTQESKQEGAIIEFIERELERHPEKPYVTLSQLGKHVDRLAAFSKSKIGARITRQRVIADLCERNILQKTMAQGRTKPIQVITFAPEQ